MQPHPKAIRLFAIKEVQEFMQVLSLHRTRLFEAGESDDEIKTIFERRGKRKMIQVVCDPASVSAMYHELDKAKEK